MKSAPAQRRPFEPRRAAHIRTSGSRPQPASLPNGHPGLSDSSRVGKRLDRAPCARHPPEGEGHFNQTHNSACRVVCVAQREPGVKSRRNEPIGESEACASMAAAAIDHPTFAEGS